MATQRRNGKNERSTAQPRSGRLDPAPRAEMGFTLEEIDLSHGDANSNRMGESRGQPYKGRMLRYQRGHA